MYRRTRTVVLAGLAALATVGLAACGSDSLDGSAHAAAPAASTAAPAAGTSAPEAAPDPAVPAPDGARSAGGPGSPGAVTPGGAASGGTVSGGGTAGGSGGHANPPAPSAPSPKITSFRVVKQPTCPVHGTPDAPFSAPGTPVEIAWTVTGAKGAAIAVDNPGTYGAYGSDYGASGKLSLSFPCDDGGTTTHSYTVWPAGAHDVSRTITVSAHSDG